MVGQRLNIMLRFSSSMGNRGRCSDISVDKNWSECNFGPCHEDQDWIMQQFRVLFVDWIMGSSVSGRDDGGFKILSGSASKGSIGATSPSLHFSLKTKRKDGPAPSAAG